MNLCRSSSSGAARRVAMLAAAAFCFSALSGCASTGGRTTVAAEEGATVTADTFAAAVAAAKLSAETGDWSVVKYAGGAGVTGVAVALMSLWLSHRREVMRINRNGHHGAGEEQNV